MARGNIGEEVTDLRRELNDLNLLINKLVTTNLNVQSKITESLIKMDSLIGEVKEMVELLQVATELESQPTEFKGFDNMNKGITELNKSLVSVETYVKKLYRRVFILSALRKDKEDSPSPKNAKQ